MSKRFILAGNNTSTIFTLEHLKRLSPPVHGGRMDPKKAKRVAQARVDACAGEYRARIQRDFALGTAGSIWTGLQRKHKHEAQKRLWFRK